ncbi:hypothetical protein WDU94_009967, partial [Cyamophila willieti]
VVPKLGSAAPQGAVKDFQGPRRPGQKKNILCHNLFKKTRFSNNFRDILHSNLSDKGPAELSEGQ